MKKIRTCLFLFICSLIICSFVPVQAAAVKDGPKIINGSYYYYKNGKPVKNKWVDYKGNRYYFQKNGKAAIGLTTIEKYNYYFTKKGKLARIPFVKGKKLYRVNPNNGKILKAINKNSKMVCLTFDDGPWRSSTDTVISTLKKYKAAATFFIIGSNTNYYGEKIKSEYALGCDIANHTYSHLIANSYTSVNTMVNEIQNGNAALNRFGIPNAKYFRAPGGGIMANGQFNSSTRAAATQMNLPLFYWSKVSNDCAGASVSSIIYNCTTNLTDGDIILMHDSYATTAQALPYILNSLKTQKFEPVTLTEYALCRGITYTPGTLYRNYSSAQGKMMRFVPPANGWGYGSWKAE